jgi:2-acylglycerol O-acyltransferase 2
MTWLGCVSADRRTALKHLKKPESIGICPDGVAGIFNSDHDHEVLRILDRKGFIRLALVTGTPIVPIYFFGNTETFTLWYDSLGIMKSLSKALKCGVVFIWGRFFLPIAYRTPLFGIAGKVIEVPLIVNPSKEDVDKYHAIALDRLKGLFDSYKVPYGWAEKELFYT